jgi:hypothetical protein
LVLKIAPNVSEVVLGARETTRLSAPVADTDYTSTPTPKNANHATHNADIAAILPIIAIVASEGIKLSTINA